MQIPKIVLHFSGWRSIDKPFFFRCPQCGVEVRPQNAKCITCWNCGEGGNLERFSSIERMAA